MLLKELLALAMSKAEEHDIHFVEWHLVCKAQLSFPEQSFMHI